ncbi:MAG: nitrophenyl compound nitroreductase subunit ArsF family protein [Candidatus Nanoarchaeia archaeon]|nr:nitrophenyl compound nitroreductase subunit ArsF family protein [Candidatus Nanoarchaeia archaeon]
MKNTAFIILAIALLLAGCSEKAPIDSNAVVSGEHQINIDKLEIYHFHGTHQCYSCKTVGAYAEETVNTFFPNELKTGKIVFRHINGELPENMDLVMKYKATGSSLWLGVYTKEGEFKAEQNTNVWYKINNKIDYMNYLREVIEQKLAGN